MNVRPKGDADPDATVMLPAGSLKERGQDDDATVMIPMPKGGEDATVMIPAPRPDDDATVMISAREADEDATVVLPSASSDPDATVMIPPVATAEPAVEPDPDATIAIPTPGRKRTAGAPGLPVSPVLGRESAGAESDVMGGLNPLIAAGNPILAIAAQIRHSLRHPDLNGLRLKLEQGIASFEHKARAAGAEAETIDAARLALRAVASESAASTPWGAAWKTDEPDRFFELVERRAADPGIPRELLEFFYVCLSLGFEGRTATAGLRMRVLERLRPLWSGRDGELSGHWRGANSPARKPMGTMGLWVAAAGIALLVVGLYAAYSVSLGSLSDPVARQLAQLKTPPEPEAPRSQAGQAAMPHVAQQLATEIERGELSVTDAAGRSTIVIRSDRLFASGSARLEADVEPVVLRVAEALNRVPGSILVTGHTDDVPIRTARFPSNWELSAERAASVVKLMAGRLAEPGRLQAEGLADSAPTVPNDSALNRARNRRVEIILGSGS